MDEACCLLGVARCQAAEVGRLLDDGDVLKERKCHICVTAPTCQPAGKKPPHTRQLVWQQTQGLAVLLALQKARRAEGKGWCQGPDDKALQAPTSLTCLLLQGAQRGKQVHIA